MNELDYASLASRYWNKVIKGASPYDCWDWDGAKSNAGYGKMAADGKVMEAHRFAYELVRGAIPAKWEIDHLCRNPGCTNWRHLEAVPKAENVMRGQRFRKANGVGMYASLAQCKYADHPPRPRGQECKECMAMFHKKYYQQKKARNVCVSNGCQTITDGTAYCPRCRILLRAYAKDSNVLQLMDYK